MCQNCKIVGNNSSGIISVTDIQALLEVVNDLFEEQTDLEKIVRKIMHRAQTLLKCERCSVQLLEDIESPVLFFCLPSHFLCLSEHLCVSYFFLSQSVSENILIVLHIFFIRLIKSFISNLSGGEVYKVV